MNWVLSDTPSHKVGHNGTPSSNGSGIYICDWARAGPEDTSKLYEEVAQMSMIPTLATLTFPFQPVPLASWGVPYDQKKRRFGPGL